MATMMTATDSLRESVSTNPAATLTDRGTAMCRLIDFEDAFGALAVADRAYFAYRLSELLVEACDAEVALR